jgi:CRISPR/Cas system-associated endoribonuclease Cas2
MHPKTSFFKTASVYGCIILLLFMSLFFSGDADYNKISLTSISYAHLSHLPHYNGFGAAIGKYYVDEALDPEFTPPLQPTQITFSIQDYGGNDVYNVYTMLEIYQESTGQRIKAFPWTKQDIGDFSLYYTFPSVGNYNIVLSIANDNNSNNHNGIEPPRDILTGNLNCDCDRGVFSVSITKNFGNIFFTAIFAGVLGAIAVFGSVAVFAYKSRKKQTKLVSNINSDNSRAVADREILIKYFVMMVAIGAGMVHLAVYSEHGSLRIQYSIFLLAAAAAQFAYGIVYVLLTLTIELDSIRSIKLAKEYYKKSVILNLFGLIGSSILLGLYIYSVVLPPPLSPINRPEAVDVAGILDKSLEVVLVIGILYLMWIEKKRITKLLVEVK